MSPVAKTPKSPVSQLPAVDYGAETLRNYRYQAAYAIVLLTAAAAKKNDFAAIWCEQEDDLVGEVTESVFESFQVKSRKPELGPWTINDEPFVKAVKSFVSLDLRFPGQFRRFHFVSNAECASSQASAKRHLCPKMLATAATECFDRGGLKEAAAKGLTILSEKTAEKPEAVFHVLQKLVFPKAPSRDAFPAELAQNHLRQLPWCQLTQPRLERIIHALVEIIETASSLGSQDPSRHYISGNGSNPQHTGKRVSVEEFILKTRELAKGTFHYLRERTSHPLQRIPGRQKDFDKKLKRGGLEDYTEPLRTQMLAAHAQLLEWVTRDPEEGDSKLVQVEQAVQAACDHEHLRARQKSKVFGQKMLINVQDRLETMAKEEPEKVHGQCAETLIGMAGLLTEKCTVWWSEKFNLEEDR